MLCSVILVHCHFVVCTICLRYAIKKVIEEEIKKWLKKQLIKKGALAISA